MTVAVGVDDLAKYLGFITTPTDTEMLDRALGTARGIIWPYLIMDPGSIGPGTNEEAVLDSAVLTVAADEYRRKDAGATGNVSFADGTDLVAQLPYDQMRAVWPKLIGAGLVNVSVA